MASSNHIFSALAFVGFVLILILFPIHFRARNVGTCLYIIWTSMLCLLYFVNSIVWDSNVVNLAPLWCDISSRLIFASAFGNQLSLLCIARRLYRLTTLKAVNQCDKEKRYDMIVDFCIGIGIPILFVPSHYVVENYRFIIFEERGCYSPIALTPPSIPLVLIWPAIFGLVTVIYAGLAGFAAIRQRANMKEIMKSSDNPKLGQYWRLLALAGITTVCTIPYALLYLFFAVFSGPLVPYSWGSIHANDSLVMQVPTSEWHSDVSDILDVELERWIILFNAFMFFTFFGLTEDARQCYRFSFFWVGRYFGHHPSESSTSGHPGLHVQALQLRQPSSRLMLGISPSLSRVSGSSHLPALQASPPPCSPSLSTPSSLPVGTLWGSHVYEPDDEPNVKDGVCSGDPGDLMDRSFGRIIYSASFLPTTPEQPRSLGMFMRRHSLDSAMPVVKGSLNSMA